VRPSAVVQHVGDVGMEDKGETAHSVRHAERLSAIGAGIWARIPQEVEGVK
jgi:hypothetical protein